MSMVKTGAAFLVGTMCGAFLTRGFESRCQRLKEIRGGDRRCPRKATENKPGDANKGPEMEKQITETVVGS
ncbi:hypothetical protein DITRI_Ditri13aG0020800 [Diplodiscus trichospermus]